MGQKAAVLEKKPELVQAVMADPRLLKMVGVKSTDSSPGYTERYDNGQISIEALKELVESPNFSIEEFYQRISSNASGEKGSDIDMAKLNDMVKNMDIEKVKEMVNGEDMSQIGDLVKGLDESKLGEIKEKISEINESQDTTQDTSQDTTQDSSQDTT